VLRFVQFSDVHLDSRLGGKLGLPEEKRAVLAEDLRRCVSRACEEASRFEARLMLIPGDLFDFETVRIETARYAAEQFSTIPDVHIFIAPGNHDSLCPGSPYLPDSGVLWPDNVHIFRSESFESVIVDDLGCSVTGLGLAHSGTSSRLLETRISRPAMPVSLLVFHGSRDFGRPPEKETVLPFTDAQLLAQGFTYAAIGHYHEHAAILDQDDKVRAAYSGCTMGRGVDESGVKVVLKAAIDSEGTVQLQTQELAPRRVISACVDVTGALDTATINYRLENALASTGARDSDLIELRFTGRAPFSLSDLLSSIVPAGEYFHFNSDASSVVPDYDLDVIASDSAASTVRSAFVRELLARRQAADTDDEKKTITHAIYYGLAALDGRTPEPRCED